MNTIKRIIPVSGMTCASCVSGIEKEVGKMKGVVNVAANLAENTVLIEFEDETTKLSDISKKIKDIGYTPLEDDAQGNNSINHRKNELKQLQKRLIFASILAIPVFIQGMFFHHYHNLAYFSFVLTFVLMIFPGRRFYTSAWRQALKGRSTMDTLVALSTGVAFVFSSFSLLNPSFFIEKGLMPAVYFESSAIIIAFILLGKFLEEKAKTKSALAIHLLMDLQPRQLTVVRNNEEITIGVDEVKLYDRVRIKPSDRIPVDGKVISGQSWVDESMFSGEVLPVKKEKGQEVKAGTQNQQGSLLILAEHTGDDTHLAHIVRIIREAQASKAPIQKLADKISAWFVPVVILLAVITFGLWLAIGGLEHLNHAILSMVSVLIIACPCALGLATPAAIMSGINRAALEGILIKDASNLEMAARINKLFIDKTGTLTFGMPTLTKEEWWTDDQLAFKHVVAAMERLSEHPLSTAIVDFYKDFGQQLEIENFEAIPGMGISGSYQGKRYFIGSNRLLINNNITIDTSKTGTDYGLSEVYFSDESKCLARFLINDPVKPEAKSVVEQLNEFNIEIEILSGDKESAVMRIANECNITAWHSELLPEDKHQIIKESQGKNSITAMVGDGINDAAALAEANVSIAMGHGSDIAMETAGITLMGADLLQIPKAIKISKRTLSIIQQNLFWAFFYNIICLPLAAGLLYPFGGWLLSPMIAGAAMAFSSVSVVSNSLRLKFIKL
ncbi:MAG: heavy metal translocating P-type ATPase [Bacteroidales bacterium]|nr:heavy metal translocating P-type ATPase [Bacteroidales bacterium]